MKILLAQPEYLAELNERLEGLAEAYAEDSDIMRFHLYRPDKVLAQFQKFAKDAVPYQAREGFAWEEHPVFITQDEIDTFLAGGGAYSDGRLSTYAFFLQDKSDKEKVDFIKRSYGQGGRSHALSGADNSHADYDGKGLKLARGKYGSPNAEVLLKWPKVAKRVEYLIEQDKYLKAADFSRMPEYEREQMTNRIIGFYYHLPEEIERPFIDNFFHEEARKELPVILENQETAEELVAKMDAALAALPLDFKDYAQRAQTLADFHQYIEGSYTIFPERKKETEIGEGRQLSLFDFVNQSAPDKVVSDKQEIGTEAVQMPEPDAKIVPVEESITSYSRRPGEFIYLEQNHLYQIDRNSDYDVYLKDMENPAVAGRVISQKEFDRVLAENPLNAHLLKEGNPLQKDSRSIYKECLYTMLTAVRAGAVYDVIRSRAMDADTAFAAIQGELDNLMEQNAETAPVMTDAYDNWEYFRDWISEDVFQRTYQDYLVDRRDAIALHENDPEAPQWVKGMVVEANWEEIKLTLETREYKESIVNEQIEQKISDAMEAANTYFEEFSPEQMDVIYDIAEIEQNLVPLLNPKFPPEQMQLIADVMKRIAADEQAVFGNELRPPT